jgi:hypothetical protein
MDFSNRKKLHDLRATWFGKKGQYSIPNNGCESYDEDAKEVSWRGTIASIPIFLR